MWYLHSHFTWDWFCHSCIWLSFQPRGAFPEGEPNFSCRRWVRCNGRASTRPRPEAVVSIFNDERMPNDKARMILTINGGSSTVKYAGYSANGGFAQLFK